MTNLTHNSYLCVYFSSLRVSSNIVLIIRRINCINTSGICHCVSVCRSERTFRPAHETVTDTERHIPDVVLIQLILLMMSTRLLETYRELKQKHIEKNCASSWSFTKNHSKMHGQQNIKSKTLVHSESAVLTTKLSKCVFLSVVVAAL
jgi:hypothetical protein